MFEKLMFWKKKDDWTSGSSGSTGFDAGSLPQGGFDQPFNPLDVQNPPAFGDAHSANMAGMSSAGMSHNPVQSFPTGMETSTGSNSFGSSGFGNSNSGSSGFGSTDPFSSQPSSSQPVPSQSGYVNSSPQMMGYSSLPSRSAPADNGAIHPRDIELILSRLELVRSEIENVNHRLSFIEQTFARQQAANGSGSKNKAWY